MFCRFLLPKFPSTFTLKACILPSLWSHRRTQSICSAVLKGTAWAQTPGHAGQGCTPLSVIPLQNVPHFWHKAGTANFSSPHHKELLSPSPGQGWPQQSLTPGSSSSSPTPVKTFQCKRGFLMAKAVSRFSSHAALFKG